MEGPAKLPSEVLGRQVKHWRADRRKISAQALAKRCADAGAPKLTRAAISKIEIGERGVSVDEWLALAYALSLPAAMLLVDLAAGIDVAVTATHSLPAWEAWDWITGGHVPPRLPDNDRVHEFNDAQQVLHIYADSKKAAEHVAKIGFARANARYAGNEDKVRELDEQYVEALRALAMMCDTMVEHGVNPPQYPEPWVKTMRELGMLRYPDRVAVWHDEPRGPQPRDWRAGPDALPSTRASQPADL